MRPRLDDLARPTRRTLLRALGLTAGSLVLPSIGRAAPTRPRLLVYTTSHGTVYDRWRLRPSGEPEDVDFVADLAEVPGDRWSDILAPLQPHARRLLVLDGLCAVAAIQSDVAPHDAAHAGSLTGRFGRTPSSGGTAVPDGPSVDQILAATGACPLPSLEYSVGGLAVCFDDAGTALPYESDPLNAYTRLFPGWDDASARSARLRLRQESVLDLARDRYGALAARLGGDDRGKLEAHQALIRDLEDDLAALAVLRDECGLAEAPDALLDRADPEYSAAAARAFFKLARVALSCRFTDVVSLRHDDVTNDAIGAPAGDLHNDYAHNAAVDPEAAEVMTDYHRFQAERVLELLDALDATPDGDGTLLDGTIAVWNNEMATGPHTFANLPLVLAGGPAGFAWGRYVRWAPGPTVTGTNGTEAAGPPHNRALVTLAQAMGEAVESVGEVAFSTADGGTIDATGALDRVFAD